MSSRRANQQSTGGSTDRVHVVLDAAVHHPACAQDLGTICARLVCLPRYYYTVNLAPSRLYEDIYLI